jgi:transcriptional regulator GlxA family with amidase domain
METNVEAPLSVAQVAQRAGVGQRRLARLFSRSLGSPPHRYYVRLRLDRARELLRHGQLPVGEVALATGFSSQAHFARAYKAHHGCRPSVDQASGIDD